LITTEEHRGSQRKTEQRTGGGAVACVCSPLPLWPLCSSVVIN
jgi:hypothetical protein